MTNKLEQYREEIVSLNDQILELLSKRGELAQKIGEEKIKQGTRVYDPQREKEMINQLLDKNKSLKRLLIYKNQKMKNIFMYHVN